MNHEKALRLFASILDDDLTVGSNHLIDDLPLVFTATDFLYFFALREHFWPEIKDENERLMISVAMTESYLSSLLHVYSGEYHFDEVEHQLEHCILYGDLAFFIVLITLPDERKNKDGCLCQFDWLIFIKKQKESIA